MNGYHGALLMRKINHIHLNCIRGKWKLAEHWDVSTAVRGKNAGVP